MADRCRRVDYFYVEVPDQPGQGAQVFTKLKEAGVNLLAFTAFPTTGNKAQIDLVPENSDALTKAAKAAGLNLSPKKQALFVQGSDRVGAAAECFKKLADAKISVRAGNACSSERGYGLILWVKPESFEAAAKALGA
jgi:hypothetical protein